MVLSYYLFTLSLILFVGLINAQSQIFLPSCNVSGETRLFLDQNSSFPQICVYINTTVLSTNYTTISGLFFISMCYTAGWGDDNREVFCPSSGYTGHRTRPERLNVSNVGIPKYTNVACSGNENSFLSCGGNVTTTQCDYVYELYCDTCSSAGDCLGGSNSMCSAEGLCSCIACANGDCYAGGCLCFTGWVGDACAQRICTPACQNGGNCQDNATCACPFPYTGPQCQVNMTCSPACLNGGQCNVNLTSSTLRCSCTQGYTGSHCQVPLAITTTILPGQTSTPILSPTPTPTLTLSPTPTPALTLSPTPTIQNSTTIPTSVTVSEISYLLVISIVIPVLGCVAALVVLLMIIFIIFICVSMSMLRHKHLNNSGDPKFNDVSLNTCEERRATIYASVDESAMLEYGMPPALPPNNNDYEMNSPKKKTSHYEIEDEVLERKALRHKLTEKQTANNILVEDIVEGNETSNDPQDSTKEVSPVESPYLALLDNSNSQEPSKAHSNPALVDSTV